MAGTADPRIVETKNASLKGSMLVVGFPTHGLVGSVAVSYLRHSLDMKQVGFMVSEEFPPTVVMEGGVVSPPVRIYASRTVCGVNRKSNQLVAVLSDVQPSANLLNPIGRSLLDFAEHKQIDLVVALEGQPVEETDADNVRVVAMANGAAAPLLDTYSFERADGLVTGFAGALLLASVDRSIPVLCLVSQAHRGHPDARAAARILEVINPMVPMLVFDTQPLRRKAQEIELELRRNMNQQQESMKGLKEPQAGGEMYR
jgi:uncharacterized protein